MPILPQPHGPDGWLQRTRHSSPAAAAPPVRSRNDPRQYDDLIATWWDPAGRFAMLGWLSAARARLLPPPLPGPPPVLVDLACGAGLLAPHVAAAGYRHIGLDLSTLALSVAREHGVVPAAADVAALPLPDACAAVVVAGEVLEHVHDLETVVGEAVRVLAPGGLLLIDTIARTALARLAAITLAERLPGGPPRRLHDPALLVDRRRLRAAFASHGLTLHTRGLRPSAVGYVRWLADRSRTVPMVPTRSTAILFQAVATKPHLAARVEVA